MHPITLNAYQSALASGLSRDDAAMRVLAGPHHFHVSEAIHKTAVKIAVHEGKRAPDGEPIFMPVDSRLPADQLVMTIDGCAAPIILSKWQGGREHEIGFGLFAGNRLQSIAAWAPGQEGIRDLREENSPLSREHVEIFVWRLSFILSLMNTPRLVDLSPAAKHECSRPYLRQVSRLTQRPALAFTRVTWTIGKPVKGKNSQAVAEDNKRPLHWARAYWAYAKEGEPKAEWVNLPFKSGWGWYRWVADSWRGHPHYGLKLQDHAPRLTGERSRHAVTSFAILPATKAAALTDVQRNTLAAAGYLPTGVLQ